MYGGTRPEKRKNDEEDANEEAEIIGADEDLEDVKVGVKRPRPENDLSLADRRQLKRQKKAQFQKYYSGTFYWKCASWLLY